MQKLFFMKILRTRLIGSSYVGLFAITNDNICFIPKNTDEETIKKLEETLDVKAIKTSIYDSALLAVFAKMNNKIAFLPNYATAREIEVVEKEIKVKIIETELALGNALEVNDFGAIISAMAQKTVVGALKKCSLNVLQTNIGPQNAIGSSLVATNKGFLISPNASKEEVKKIQDTLNVTGGSSTANTGDTLVRNSVLANTKGIIAGDLTTGFELNRIDEALNKE